MGYQAETVDGETVEIKDKVQRGDVQYLVGVDGRTYRVPQYGEQLLVPATIPALTDRRKTVELDDEGTIVGTDPETGQDVEISSESSSGPDVEATTEVIEDDEAIAAAEAELGGIEEPNAA